MRYFSVHCGAKLNIFDYAEMDHSATYSESDSRDWNSEAPIYRGPKGHLDWYICIFKE